MHKEEKESSLTIAKRPWNGTVGALELGHWDDTVGTQMYPKSQGSVWLFILKQSLNTSLVQVAAMAETWVSFIPSTNVYQVPTLCQVLFQALGNTSSEQNTVPTRVELTFK